VEVDSENIEVEISVHDQGLGINEQDQRNLFKPYFVTSDKESKSVNWKSHGLGLSICHKIAQALQGKIKVESRLGVGSTFIFTFIAKKGELLI
jgi:signal transduction histidine kinase